MTGLFEIKKAFVNNFGYSPNEPNEIFFDETKYIEILRKSIKDNFDYTIKLYGTDPKRGTQKHSGIFIN